MTMFGSKRNFFIVLLIFVFGIIGCFSFILPKKVVPIAMYHHIASNPEGRVDTVSPESFEKQLIFLKKHGYHVVSLKEYVDSVKSSTKLLPKSIILTFDDGNDDNYTYAYRILKKHGLSAIFFVGSDDIGKERFLSEAQISEMIEGGMKLGSHTRNQVYLPDASHELRVDEIVNSRKNLEGQFGVPVDFIAYPIGGFDEEIKMLVKQAGYSAAVTTNRGNDKSNTDLFELNRIKIKDTNTSSFILWAKFSGFYNLFRTLKNPN